MTKERKVYSRVVCIGAGIAGIGLAIQLQKRLQCRDIHIYDRNASPGGVWAVQKYPGVACDIPADFYSFSFTPDAEWTKFRPGGEEFEGYLQGLATSYGLWPLITFKTECESATWIADASQWLVTLRDLATGQQFQHTCDVLCVATGQLSVAKIPPIPGLQDFRGPVIHTASWNRQINLTAKRVAVIGNGASGSQLVPEVVLESSSVLHIFRSAQWYLPPVQVPYGPVIRWILRNVTFARKLLRFLIFVVAELAFRGSSLTGRAQRTRQRWQQNAKHYMRSLAPVKYHDILIPKYDLGCKRPVFNSGYLQCLHSPKVEVLAQNVEVIADGIICQEKVFPVDIIILATGYATNRAIGFPIRGCNGEVMDDHWDSIGGPSAYGTIAVHGFPNLFLVKGPNTVTGHTSAILVAENVIQLILSVMKPVIQGHASTVEVTAAAEVAYSKKIQAASRGRVWYSGCASWYIREDGWNGTLYPWSQVYCWWFSLFPKWSDWRFTSNKETMPQ
ncbi:4-hydroxyacetophenone monooxygenase [Gymnopilus junonius]|uniref:4-hydroxyacetophenone monooxygenase n=1 Tax=Gymnopilus junonius TaxID=109634 RepID=A0A9P5NNY6_GYMJU|nr:4-hydroxyacetophenone monooxygenase [Gymnopilus junonius]